MLKLLNRKDFRIVYLAAILILCTALFAPPTALAKYGGDPFDVVDGPGSKPEDSPAPHNIAPIESETQTVAGRLLFSADTNYESIVILINIPGSIVPVPVKLSLPSWLDWGEQ